MDGTKVMTRDEAMAWLRQLEAEQQKVKERVSKAVRTGDVNGLREAKGRERDLLDEITLARVAVQRADIALKEREVGDVVAGIPPLVAALEAAQAEYEAARLALYEAEKRRNVAQGNLGVQQLRERSLREELREYGRALRQELGEELPPGQGVRPRRLV
jgi:hypothetical protein